MIKNNFTLGIYNSNTAGACLFNNGELIYAASEERFTRKKQQNGMPKYVLEDMKKYTGVNIYNIKDVAYGGYNHPNIEALKDYLEFYALTRHNKVAERIENSLRVDFEYVKNFFSDVKKIFPKANVHLVDHHQSHAFAAYAFSGKNNISIITADGRGDLQSSVIWNAKDGMLKRVRTFCEFKSLGFFYGQVTKALGFVPYRHEGKVTGLAAMGHHTQLVDIFYEYIHFQDGDIRVSKDFQPFNNPDNLSFFTEIITKYPREDIAYAAQKVLENVVLDIIKHYCDRKLPLAVAGGIFGNVKLNQRIRESGLVQNLYVFPEMSDGGLCVGAAASLISQKNLNTLKNNSLDNSRNIFKISNMYLGNEAIWNDIDLQAMSITKKTFSSENDFLSEVVDALVSNKLVGVVSGRMEFGPRALGGRSIIFQATGALDADSVNERFERSEFMPFAPVTLASAAKEMYPDYQPSDINTKYMTTCYSCSDKMRSITPLVVHTDNTARPQIIDETNQNRIYYSILNAYYNKTGIPTLVNTSFNRHEEPIVCSAIDALRALSNGMVDMVVNDKSEIYVNTYYM